MTDQSQFLYTINARNIFIFTLEIPILDWSTWDRHLHQVCSPCHTTDTPCTCKGHHELLELLLVLAQVYEEQPPEGRVEGRAAAHVGQGRGRARVHGDAQEREMFTLHTTNRGNVLITSLQSILHTTNRGHVLITGLQSILIVLIWHWTKQDKEIFSILLLSHVIILYCHGPIFF